MPVSLGDDSDDDSDMDFLLQPPVFARPKKPEKKRPEPRPILSLEQMLSERRNNANAGTKKESAGGRKRKQNHQAAREGKAKRNSGKDDETKAVRPRAQRRTDPEWIEKQARMTVEEELKLDMADRIDDLDGIGWYRESKKRKADVFYPAILSGKNSSEARILLKNKNTSSSKTRNKIRIQYIGATYRYTSHHQEVASSRWIPLSKSTDLENEKRLQGFIKAISPDFKKNLLDLKIEELAIRKIWEKVRTRTEERRAREKEERAARATAEAFPPVPVTQDSDSNSQNSGADAHAAGRDIDSDSDCDNASSCDESLPGSSETRQESRKPPLRVGDEVEFYDVMGTHGDPSSLRRATVVGVQSGDSRFPLLLSNTLAPLPANHMVRRLPDGRWRPVSGFALRSEGGQTLAATNNFREIRAQVIKAANDFWKNDGKGGNDIGAKEEKAGNFDRKKETQKKRTKDGNKVKNGDRVSKNRRASLRIRRKGDTG